MTVTQLRSKYQIKVSLHRWSPPIWRRLLVPSSITLDKLHMFIQHAMGWENCHLHNYKKDGIIYEISEDYIDLGDDGLGEYNRRDESKYKLSQIISNEKDSMEYIYDFGDNWTHRIVLEKILPYDSMEYDKICIAGKRACPPEDCGGLFGYQNLLIKLNNPSHREHKYIVEWVGEGFDYEHFDVKKTNQILQRLAKQIS